MRGMKVHNPNNLPTKPIADLLPTQGNLKDLSETNYKKLKNTIERRGFSYPVYVWEDADGLLHLLDGHQRRQVLTTEGWNDPIPYLKVPAKDLQEAMARLLEITSQYATITQEGIDEFIGKYELNEAEVYESTSFDALGSYGSDEEDTEVEEDEAPEVDESEPPKSKLGEMYQLGRHRILCGDATKREDVERLMDGKKADMVFTDPPYGINLDTDNTKISGGWAGVVKGATNKKYSKVINDNIDYDATHIFRDFDYVKEIFLWGANYFANTLPNLTKSSWIVWDKTNDSTIYTIGSEFELLWSKQKHRQEIIKTRWAGAMGTETQDTKKRIHPTQKPLECLTPIINKYSDPKAVIIDLFLGSGSTLIACEQTDRTCYGMEISESYTDVVRKRWAKYVYPDRWEAEWQELTPKVEV